MRIRPGDIAKGEATWRKEPSTCLREMVWGAPRRTSSKYWLSISWGWWWIQARSRKRSFFYGDGVKLACDGSAVIEGLQDLERLGSRLILCRTCLDFFGLTGKVLAGTGGKMTDILAALQEADRVVSL